MQEGESIEFSGKAIANLAADADVIKKTGRILQVLIILIICDGKLFNVKRTVHST